MWHHGKGWTSVRAPLLTQWVRIAQVPIRREKGEDVWAVLATGAPLVEIRDFKFGRVRPHVALRCGAASAGSGIALDLF